MTKQEATKKLASIVKNAKKAHDKAKNEAMNLADQFGLTFIWDDTYGSREQEYLGKGSTKENWDCTKDEILEEGEWVSSSDNC